MRIPYFFIYFLLPAERDRQRLPRRAALLHRACVQQRRAQVQAGRALGRAGGGGARARGRALRRHRGGRGRGRAQEQGHH